jgi:hypothetical protein
MPPKYRRYALLPKVWLLRERAWRNVPLQIYTYNISHPHSSWTPGVFYTYFYNHARRLRLEKLLYLELSRSPSGFLKVILDPGGGFTSETAARRLLDPCGLAARSDPPVVPSGPLGVSPDPPLCPPVLVVYLCPPVLLVSLLIPPCVLRCPLVSLGSYSSIAFAKYSIVIV